MLGITTGASPRRSHARTSWSLSLPVCLRVFLCLSAALYVLVLWRASLWTPPSVAMRQFPSPPQQQELHRQPVEYSANTNANANTNDDNAGADGAADTDTDTTTNANTNANRIVRRVTPEQPSATPPATPSTWASPASSPTAASTAATTSPPPSPAALTAAPSPRATQTSPLIATILSPAPVASPSTAPDAQARASRLAALEAQRDETMRTITAIKEELFTLRQELKVHAKVVAEDDARSIRELPPGYKSAPGLAQRRFRCLGWRATTSCSPDGARDPDKDRSCLQHISPLGSGYCEVQDRDSGERFRVMKVSCDTMRHDAKLRCFDAWDFPNFAIRGAHALRNASLAALTTPAPLATSASVPSSSSPSSSLSTPQSVAAMPLAMPQGAIPDSRGIVIVVYPKMLPSAYATLKTLRRQNCKLPVEIWYKPEETSRTNAILTHMTLALGPVSLRTISDPEVRGFTTKIYAIDHSAFQHVLFLDADNVPVKDPTYLFDLPDYQRTGALFWPDFWHPDHTIFNLHPRSLVWEYLDLPFVDMFEQESGQIVINRDVSERAMVMLRFYAFHKPNLLDRFKIVHGDKDLFRLAWLKVGQAFTMMSHPPSVAGNLRGGLFCGQTMVQHDPSGAVIFLHRNAKKLEGRQVRTRKKPKRAGMVSFSGRARGNGGDTEGNNPEGEDDTWPQVTEVVLDPSIWTHLLEFKPTSTRRDYTIDIFKGSKAFPKGQWCYGKESPATPHFNVQRFRDLPFAQLEDEIRAYAVEATDILEEAEVIKAEERAQAKARRTKDKRDAATLGWDVVETKSPIEDKVIDDPIGPVEEPIERMEEPMEEKIVAIDAQPMEEPV